MSLELFSGDLRPYKIDGSRIMFMSWSRLLDTVRSRRSQTVQNDALTS